MTPQRITPQAVAKAQSSRRPRVSASPNPAELLSLKHGFARVARDVCPDYEFLERFSNQYNALLLWCIEAPGPLDPAKGLWLYGNIGSGKTLLLQIIREFCRRYHPQVETSDRLRVNPLEPYTFGFVTAKNACAAYAANNVAGLAQFSEIPRLAIDEIGDETIPTGCYGTPLNVIQDILKSRYDIFVATGRHTHATSNLSIGDADNLRAFGYPATMAGDNQVVQLYGERVWDRARQMFNFVPLLGPSMRK